DRMRKASTRAFVVSPTMPRALLGFSATNAFAARPVALGGPFCIGGDDKSAHRSGSSVAGQPNASEVVRAGVVKELSPSNDNTCKLYNSASLFFLPCPRSDQHKSLRHSSHK